MAKRFFDPENSLWHWVGKIPEMVGLSLCFFFLCIPVLTAVPAWIALYDAVARNLRPDEKGTFRRFFRSFRRELGRGLLLSLLWLGAVLVLAWVWRILSHTDHQIYKLVYQISLLLPTGIFFWMAALQSRFAYAFGTLLKHSVIFAISYLPATGVLLLALGLVFLGCWYFLPLLLAAPALLALLQTIPLENALKAHMPEASEPGA